MEVERFWGLRHCLAGVGVGALGLWGSRCFPAGFGVGG